MIEVMENLSGFGAFLLVGKSFFTLCVTLIKSKLKC